MRKKLIWRSASGEEAPQNVMAQFTRSLRKRRSFFFQKARLSCATTCPGDKNRHSQEFMSRASRWTSLGYGKREIEVSGRARSPAKSFGNAVQEHFLFHSLRELLPRANWYYRGRGKNYAANQETRVSLPVRCIKRICCEKWPHSRFQPRLFHPMA